MPETNLGDEEGAETAGAGLPTNLRRAPEPISSRGGSFLPGAGSMFSITYASGTVWNDASWENARFNELLKKARVELSDDSVTTQ